MFIFRSAVLCFLAFLISCGRGASIDAPQDELFITLPATDSLLIVDPLNQSEISRVKIGKLPHNMRLSPDGSKVYIALVGSQAVAEVDSSSGELLQTFLTDSVPMKRADDSPIEPHVLQQADLHTSCFDCHNGKENGAKPVIVGTRPFGLTVTEDNLLIVANTLSANINFINLLNGEIIRSIDIAPSGDAHEPTELAILENRLYVTVRPTLPSTAVSELRAYDIESGVLLSQTDVGSAVTALEIDAENNLIYTTNFESNTLDKFGLNTELIESFTVGDGPFGLNLEDDNLLVANYYNNSISKISLLNKEVQTQLLKTEDQQFPNPTHMVRSWDQEKIYLISGGTTGYLLTLDAEKLAIVSNMEIDSLPFDVINIKK